MVSKVPASSGLQETSAEPSLGRTPIIHACLNHGHLSQHIYVTYRTSLCVKPLQASHGISHISIFPCKLVSGRQWEDIDGILRFVEAGQRHV